MGGIMWPLAWILAFLFTLLYFSYPMHMKYMATRNPLYKVLSLGVSTPERYRALKPLMKMLAAVALIPLAFWAIYPATLFVMQTSLFIWKNWTLLPAIYFADTFVTATAAAILAAWIVSRSKLQQLDVPSLITIHGAGSIAVAVLLLIQVWIWSNKFGGSLFYAALDPVIDRTYVAIGLFLLTFALSLVASKYLALSLVIPFTGLVAAVVNKWNIIVRAQAGMRSGTAFLEPGAEYLIHELPVMMSIVAAGVFLAILITSIFPLEVRNHD
jgi:Predicted membrane protein